VDPFPLLTVNKFFFSKQLPLTHLTYEANNCLPFLKFILIRFKIYIVFAFNIRQYSLADIFVNPLRRVSPGHNTPFDLTDFFIRIGESLYLATEI
jgi:hypothetical protein